MTTNNHPAHGPVSLDRLHQISEILSKAAAQSDGGNLGYAMADAVKVIDEVLGLRRNYLALRCEIEDVQSQLYEAENQANEYDRELQERRKGNAWNPISEPPTDYRVVYCWSSESGMGVEARYLLGEWIPCHEDEEDEVEFFTHWIELPQGPKQ
ncbi:hypothetical protein [Citrobacter meridianamericanus]|uniref:DUF551 domain-containing protein n=2 Tax=Citrobacter TaxID=544 RepID=A0ABT1B415_9ENTR|nr:hypothetical protein [Citrobacter meridianamericanus]MCO5780625.1 hypothetical protein [Citrobacter meridianamericanus]